MGGLFHPDGAFARYGAKLWDMMWLNILTVISSLPVFTAGTAMTAMHYVLLKIFRDEEGAITAAFSKAFRENFRQSTVISLIFAVAAYLLVLSAGIALALSMGWIRYLLIAGLVLVVCAWNWSFVFQSRYRNTISGTVKYSFLVLAAHPIRSVVMAALFVLPIAAVLVAPKNLILALMVGFTLPGFVQVFLYNKVLIKLETAKKDVLDEECMN